MSLVQIETSDKIAWVSLVRPEKRNAISQPLLRELQATLTFLEGSAKVGVIVLTGTGDVFAAGGDLDEMKGLSPLEAHAHALAGQAVLNRIEGCPKPVIAALNGWTLGGGMELALACALRVASEEARLGFPEVSLGLLPGWGGTQRLPRLVGEGVALDMLLTGESLSAAEALGLGLVSRVFPAADLRSGTERLARLLLTRAPLALRAVMELARSARETPLPQGLAREAERFGLVRGSRDAQEGLQAFLEKRPAKFKGI